MPDMGYVPPIQNLALPGPAQITQQPGLVQGIAAGLPIGATMATQAQQIQASKAAIDQKNRELDIMQLEQAEKALSFASPKMYPTMWKNVVPILNRVTGMNLDPGVVPANLTDVLDNISAARKMGQPGSDGTPGPVDGNHVKDYMLQQLMTLAPAQQAQALALLKEGSPGDVVGLDANDPSKMITYNKELGVPGSVSAGSKIVPTTMPATVYSQAQDTIRAAASATAPLVGSAYSVNLAKTALSKGDELNDHIAIQEFGKLVNNGTPVPLAELQKMASSGTWGPKFGQAFSKFTGEGALSREQRTMLNSALDTFGASFQAQTATRTAQYPGATPPNLPSVSAYKVGQVVKFRQGSYKKIKTGPDTDASTWGPSGTP